MIGKRKSIEAINKLYSDIPTLYHLRDREGSCEYKKWKYEVENIILQIFGEDSKQYKSVYDKLNPRFVGMGLIGTSSSVDYQKTYLYKLRTIDAMLRGFEKALCLDEDDLSEAHSVDIQIIKLLERFHKFVRQLKNRHENRTSIDVQDEYDVQDLLYAILKLHFDDVRKEETTPSRAGCASRMDFLLKKEQIVLEVKKTRKGLSDKEIGEQLSVDKIRYKSHPDCKLLICFVYDPDEILNNAEGLIQDLNEDGEGMKVKVVVSPKV